MERRRSLPRCVVCTHWSGLLDVHMLRGWSDCLCRQGKEVSVGTAQAWSRLVCQPPPPPSSQQGELFQCGEGVGCRHEPLQGILPRRVLSGLCAVCVQGQGLLMGIIWDMRKVRVRVKVISEHLA